MSLLWWTMLLLMLLLLALLALHLHSSLWQLSAVLLSKGNGTCSALLLQSMLPLLIPPGSYMMQLSSLQLLAYLLFLVSQAGGERLAAAEGACMADMSDFGDGLADEGNMTLMKSLGGTGVGNVWGKGVSGTDEGK